MMEHLLDIDCRIAYIQGLLDVARNRKRAYEGANLGLYTDWIDESIANLEGTIAVLEQEYTAIVLGGDA
jgi:hypothetical protein